jgi:branched-subunit amino acid aminotransferase/4-amino-4-deoxychorismate lyase
VFDLRRPDPALGVFETLLVLDGRPVEPDAHLARLSTSVEALFPNRVAPSLPPLAADGTHALRIEVAPGDGHELGVRVERREALPAGRISLCSFRLPDGLGPHKWVDRSLLEEAQGAPTDSTLPLIVDEDGSVLEASRANLFVVQDGTLLTPPLDGRILPGVTRMRMLEIADSAGIAAREDSLDRDDLLASDEVFLTGSVRGIEPAVSLDGVALAGGGEIAARLAAGLRLAWTGLKTTTSFG